MTAHAQKLPDGLLIAWFGDDFTGSAAVMEVLSFAGLASVLFLDVPTPAQLARFPDQRALGIASTARAQSPDWMERHLPPVFDWLFALGAPLTHYKVCSTLDSAPHVGSIGKAIELAAPWFGGWIPCMVAAPAIRRYQAFGTLFAAAPDGVHRLDRHPVMACHPVTPMAEADVIRHLEKQTDRKFGLISLEMLHADPDAALARQLGEGAEIIALDTVSKTDECRVGELIWETRNNAIFAVGSQGLEYALVSYWQEAGFIDRPAAPGGAGPVDHIIAVSGSVSPVTAQQIDWAEQNGFAPVRLDVSALLRGDRSVMSDTKQAALQALERGFDPLIFTARGPMDSSVVAMRDAKAHSGLSDESANAAIGRALGQILRSLLERTGVRRAVISGGDTSGHACRELDIFAFTALAPTIPGAALLQAHSDAPHFDGLQLALKGGQMGSDDYFGWIKRGGGPAATGGST